MRAYPELSHFNDSQTQDIIGFGLVTYQIANNGAIPYASDDEDINITEARVADPELKTLLAQLSPDTPAEIRQVITITTKLEPKDRAKLIEVEQILQYSFSALPSQPLSPPQGRYQILLSYNLMLGRIR